MKKLLFLVPIYFCLNVIALADPPNFRTVIIAASGTDETIDVAREHTVQIVNFSQDVDSTPRSNIDVTKGSNTAHVMRASFVDDRESADDRKVNIAGPATVLVHNASTGNVFVTYRVFHDN